MIAINVPLQEHAVWMLRLINQEKFNHEGVEYNVIGVKASHLYHTIVVRLDTIDCVHSGPVTNKRLKHTTVPVQTMRCQHCGVVQYRIRGEGWGDSLNNFLEDV